MPPQPPYVRTRSGKPVLQPSHGLKTCHRKPRGAYFGAIMATVCAIMPLAVHGRIPHYGADVLHIVGNGLRRFLAPAVGFPVQWSYLSLNKSFNVAGNLWFDGYSSAYPSE